MGYLEDHIAHKMSDRTIVKISYDQVADSEWDESGRTSKLKPEVLDWLKVQGIDPSVDNLGWMSSHDFAYFGFKHRREAAMFKLVWGGL